MIKTKYKVDKDACTRLEWGGELAKIGNKLDAVSSLSFDNYGLGQYYWEVKDYEKLLAIFEAVPTPDFHWWNYWMGIAHHYLGNTDKANEYFSVNKPLYGDNAIDKMLEAMLMWNNHVDFQETVQIVLENEYGYN